MYTGVWWGNLRERDHLGGTTHKVEFESRVLRIIFGPKWDEVIGEWRKLHNEELNDLYFSPNIVRVIKSEECDGRGM